MKNVSEFNAIVCIDVHPFMRSQSTGDKGKIKVNHYHFHRIYRLDYPRNILERRRWYIEYLAAKVKVRFPRHTVTIKWGFYDPETKERSESKRRARISALKGQVTKIENSIARFIEIHEGELFFNPDEDEQVIAARAKLEVKKANYAMALNEPIIETIDD